MSQTQAWRAGKAGAGATRAIGRLLLVKASLGQPCVKEAPVEIADLAKRLSPDRIAEAERQAAAFRLANGPGLNARPAEPAATPPK